MLNVVVMLCALATAAWYVWEGMRAGAIGWCKGRLSQAAKVRDRGTTGLPDYVVAGIAFLTACASGAHIISPVVAYAVLCLAISSRLVANLFFEERERTRGRRAALLQRTPCVDPILLAWIALAAASLLLLMPSLLVASERASALLVGACCIAMILVAWRMATAPRLLAGDDVKAELLLDRMRRIARTGLVAIVTIGCASFYATIAESSARFSLTGFSVWAALIIWLAVYLRIASRTLVMS